jgi:hypothetical protein
MEPSAAPAADGPTSAATEGHSRKDLFCRILERTRSWEKSHALLDAVKCERSRRQPLVNLNAIARRDVRWWESVRPPQERARRARGQGWPGRIDWGRAAPSMAEIAAKVAAMSPPDTSIRRFATLMLALRARKEPMAPAATKEHPLARLKNLFLMTLFPACSAGCPIARSSTTLHYCS